MNFNGGFYFKCCCLFEGIGDGEYYRVYVGFIIGYGWIRGISSCWLFIGENLGLGVNGVF